MADLPPVPPRVLGCTSRDDRGQHGAGQGVSGCYPQAEDESHSFTLTSETNTATVTQLSPGHIYGFQVRARSAAGHGPYGGKVYFQTLPQGEGRPRWGGGGAPRWGAVVRSSQALNPDSACSRPEACRESRTWGECLWLSS